MTSHRHISLGIHIKNTIQHRNIKTRIRFVVNTTTPEKTVECIAAYSNGMCGSSVGDPLHPWKITKHLKPMVVRL